ncbi:uncharacterized protein FIBRA_03442 [Fibroporia radiculosa]|uniref:DNA2/NAM7 helicase-like C-terminal domain-containing protein n=1 Tax=Fibroporia radiculosa TaxID=599839 RepID=J4I9L9_9APHY|nr:uncharacterized protein FIBRA_03442 [Fibroporia radiculosa]CCM01391.1 predicted protein [Fibroporia radiculosa]
MQDRTFRLKQTIYKAPHPPVDFVQLNEAELSEDFVDTFLQTAVGDTFGVAAAYGSKGILTSIAFATPSRGVFVQMPKPGSNAKAKSKKGGQGKVQGRDILHRGFLCRPGFRKMVLDAPRLVAALQLDFGLTATQIIELWSILSSNRQTNNDLYKVLGGENLLHSERASDIFLAESADASHLRNVCERAWASCQVSHIKHLQKQLLAISPIDTHTFNAKHLAICVKSIRDADRLRALKPTKVKNDVSAEFSRTNGVLNVNLTRFKTRLRKSKVLVEISNKGSAPISASGRTVHAEGKSARISVHQNVSTNAKICSVYTIGREDPTYAELERTEAILAVLQCRIKLFEVPVVRKMFNTETSRMSCKKKDSAKSNLDVPDICFPSRPLNGTQTVAVRRILSTESNDQICLIHGPPGTGKTTVIAASVTSIIAASKSDHGVWLIAQSNVAVKNIAEKLGSVGFWEFKVLVSKDFHFEWHEHLYEDIERNVIRSDDFAPNAVGMSRLLLDSRVILCTISMLSHPRLGSTGLTRLVPVTTVIVDEASQIELGDYLPLLYKFGQNLRKLVFIGDDKQLAPYGQDDLRNLCSVFELPHLRQEAVFLDTQYRMPVPIGKFISAHVYGGRLNTEHSVNSRLSCRFVDVKHGKERRSGNSWVNDAEAHAIEFIATKLHKQSKAFRIITPYDAQRNLLENRLRAVGIPWENKCFNVDSFQGNEEEYIIVSVVRSEKIGFLSNVRRTNVMLSRCKTGMIICSSRAFLQGKASSTLMGKLATEWGANSWVPWRDLLSGRF